MSDTIRTERLALILLERGALASVARRQAPAGLDASFSKEWLADVQWLAERRLEQVTEHPDHAPWLLRAIVLVEEDDDHPAIGHINFHGPPDDGGVPEVGYSLLPEFRDRGYAIEAVRGLFDWARREHGVRRFRASVSPDNERSQNLIAKLGFVRVGEQWDEEDGLEWVYETPGLD